MAQNSAAMWWYRALSIPKIKWYRVFVHTKYISNIFMSVGKFRKTLAIKCKELFWPSFFNIILLLVLPFVHFHIYIYFRSTHSLCIVFYFFSGWAKLDSGYGFCDKISHRHSKCCGQNVGRCLFCGYKDQNNNSTFIIDIISINSHTFGHCFVFASGCFKIACMQCYLYGWRT